MPLKTDQSLHLAAADYHRHQFPSVRAAAAAYNVNEATLRRRLKGQSTSRQVARQKQQLLSPTQEALISTWVLDCEQGGYSISHAQLREFALLLLSSTGGPSTLGHNWSSRFLYRHPELRTKIGKKIDHLRFDNTTPALLQDWFDRLSTVIHTDKIRPENIYNADEKGIALGVCHGSTVIGTSLTSTALLKRAENREWVSIIETISANGRKLRPVVICKDKSLQSSWFRDGQVPNWLYTYSENGWTSNDIALQWLQRVFIPETVCSPPAPRLLLLDGHGSHMTVEFMKECWNHQIRCFYLIPHSSHVLQPLDLSCFSFIKSEYRKQVAALSQVDDAAPIKKIRFILYYALGRERGLCKDHISAGWRAAGIHPWCPQKVLNNHMVRRGVRESKSQAPISEITPIIPPNITIRTPNNSRDIQQQIQTLQGHETFSRTVRTLFTKTSKLVQTLEYHSAQ